MGITEGLVAVNAFGTSGGLGGRYLADQAKGLARGTRGLYLDRGPKNRVEKIGALDSLWIREIGFGFLHAAGHLVSRAI